MELDVIKNTLLIAKFCESVGMTPREAGEATRLFSDCEEELFKFWADSRISDMDRRIHDEGY